MVELIKSTFHYVIDLTSDLAFANVLRNTTNLCYFNQLQI